MIREEGFLPVGQIKLGMHVLEADGQVGVISGWKVVPGVQTMYNLEVAQDHTFTVGTGMWVVHNCDIPWSSITVRQAARVLDNGVNEVTVANRSEAEELFLGKFQGDGYRNTTGFKAEDAQEWRNWGGKQGTYHWDDQWDPANPGRLLNHGADNTDAYQAHLQIHVRKGGIIRIFF